jgi:inosose dehydratase
MNVRIGINPLTWTNDDMPELGGETPLETCLAEAKEAGYEGIELGNKFPREAKALRAVLEPHGLALVSGWYSGQLLERTVEQEIAAIEAHRSLLAALGSQVLIFAETARATHGDRRRPLSQRPVLKDKEWPAFCRALGQVADHLEKTGTRLVYHHHMGTVIQTEAEIDRLMENTPDSVGLLLDTGHLSYAGGDPVRAAERWGRRIGHVHCKDVRSKVLARVRDEDLPFLEAVLQGVFTVPGDGAVDYDAVFERLAAVDYRGWLVVEAEQDPAVAHPLTYAKMGFENTMSAAVGAGLSIRPLVC